MDDDNRTLTVVISCDKNQYWLLPWWLKHYRQFNPSNRVLFVAQEWPLPAVVGDLFDQYNVEDMPPERAGLPLGGSWDRAWYVKPYAIKAAGGRTDWVMWIDLDCQVVGTIETPDLDDSAGALYLHPDAPAQKFWGKHLLLDETTVNSGVVLTRYPRHEVFDRWIEYTPLAQRWSAGDQDVLSRVLHVTQYPWRRLPAGMNVLRWDMVQDPRLAEGATILHWTGPAGKAAIVNNMKSLGML